MQAQVQGQVQEQAQVQVPARRENLHTCLWGPNSPLQTLMAFRWAPGRGFCVGHCTQVAQGDPQATSHGGRVLGPVKRV